MKGNFLAKILSDEKNVYRNTWIQIVFATIAFILLVRVYPMQVYQKHTYSKQKAFSSAQQAGAAGERFTQTDKKLQKIFFSDTHLSHITLYLRCEMPKTVERAQTILFRLYNDSFSCIYEEIYSCKDIAKDGYLCATPDLDVEQDIEYYYEVLVPEDCSAEIFLPTADRGQLAQLENSTLYIDGVINDTICLAADFDYTKPLSVVGMVVYDILILVAAGGLYLLAAYVLFCYDRYFSGYQQIVQKYVRIAASIAVIIALVSLFVFSVVQNRFGGAAADRLFFTVAIAAAGFWAAGALWLPLFFPKKPKETQLTAQVRRSLIWRNYIQTVSFGFLFYALCQYVNADREYYHITNTRWMLIFLAIAFLMMYGGRQFLHIGSLIWLVIAAVGTGLYCRDFMEDEKELLVARLTCGVMAAWGLLILNTLLRLKAKSIRAAMQAITENFSDWQGFLRRYWQQILYGGFWLVFSILMFAYRFEKTWVFTAVLPFIAMFFIKLTPAARSRFLRNLTNGILLSFGLVCLFCLLHRPHHYWMLYRYGGIFHTVACTGMYLAVVIGAAVGKLYGKLRDRKKMLWRCFGEYFVTACAFGFVLLSMSRTAMLTCTVTVAAVAALAAVTYRKTSKRLLQEFGMLAAVILVSFPMVFTAIRMVPALVNDPVRYDIEFQDESFMVYKGDPINSDKYMTVERFFLALFGRFQRENTDSGEAARLEKGQNRKREQYFEKDQGLDEKSRTQVEQNFLVYNGNDLSGVDIDVFAQQSVQAAELEADGEEDKKSQNDISNGRFEIFGDYFQALEFRGHPKMAPVNEDGEDYAHAHNSYLQVAYNFGLIAGILFLAICALSLWRSICLFYTQGKKYSIYLVPFSLVVVFGFVSLTEWAFHPCIPAGFCFLVLQVLLVKASA